MSLELNWEFDVYKLKKTKFLFMTILVFVMYDKTANSILSENTPKNNYLTPIYQEQDQISPKISTPEPRNKIQQPAKEKTFEEVKAEKENNREKKVNEENYLTEITITAKRSKIEPVLPEKPKLLLTDVIENIENTIVDKSYYKFLPSNPENDFIILSGLDYILNKVEQRLSGMVDEPEIIPKQTICLSTFEICNKRLITSLTGKIEKIDFIKFSKQALGEKVDTPKIELGLSQPLSENDIKFAFNNSGATNSNKNNYYSRPEDFSNLIRNILREKRTIFVKSNTGFVDNLKILQSQLSINAQSDRNLLPNNLQTEETNLTVDLSKQTMSQIDELLKFIEQKKVIIDSQILSNTASAPLTPEQTLKTVKQEASDLTSLYDLIKSYGEENTVIFQQDDILVNNISAWYDNYTRFLNKINNLQMSNDIMTEESLLRIYELQNEIREQRKGAILLSNEILNSKKGIQLFNQTLPDLADLNTQLIKTQELFPYQDLDLILIGVTDRLNQILITLSSQNVDSLKQPISQQTLKFFPGLVPENRAMQEIMTFIFSENSSESNPPEIGLSDVGIFLDRNGFYKYDNQYLRINSSTPEDLALQILDNFNYLSQ